MKTLTRIIPTLLILLFFAAGQVNAQSGDFYFGHDLSYVNQMEDCGAVYKRFGEPVDPYSIFAEEGTNLVRARLWVDPSWWQEPLDQPEGVLPYYSDIEDVKKTIQRARDYGMDVMLDLHYSDFWADPGRQLVPRDWVHAVDDFDALATIVYEYTRDVLLELDGEGLMPDFVKVGNENNPGIMTQIPEEDGFGSAGNAPGSNNWSRHAMMFNAGIEAVREVGETASINPQIALHWSNLSGVDWWYQNIINHGVTDFDIIGFSYYYAWHGGSITQLESVVGSLKENFPGYEVMAVETGYLWSTSYGGIINEPDPQYLPVIPEKQLEYMVDYTRAVMRAGGNGVIFWEPAWVDTPCVTPWITGSSHTHVAFFHPQDLNFMENGGGKWTNERFYQDPEWPKATFQVYMDNVEVSEEGVFITGDFTGNGDWELLPMASEGSGIYSYFTYLPAGAEGAYYFVNGNNWDERETVPAECAVWWDTDRGYTIPGNDVLFDYVWGSCESITDPVPDLVTATFKVDMSQSGVDFSGGVYITGNITVDEGDWEILEMTHEGDDIFAWSREIEPGSEGAYYFLTTDSWADYQDYRETVPDECAEWWDTDRGYVIPNQDVEFGYFWGSCEEIEESTSAEGRNGIPDGYSLKQNYPNPFNPVTTISYEVQDPTHVNITVYNSLGQKVLVLVDGNQSPGIHHVNFDASALSSGLYIYRMVAGNFSETRAMTLIK